MLEDICFNEFPRDYLVREYNDNKIIFHMSDADINEFNIYAKKSLEIDNDAQRKSKDEAISIHIITDKLNTHLSILYERQICGFYGKPDFIIRLGKKLYIMVSTTRAINRNNKNRIRRSWSKVEIIENDPQGIDFTQENANRLIQKKLSGLAICKQNLECLVDEVIDEDHMVRPILHVLSPNKINAIMCIIAYNEIITKPPEIFNDIKVIISYVKNHNDLL